MTSMQFFVLELVTGFPALASFCGFSSPFLEGSIRMLEGVDLLSDGSLGVASVGLPPSHLPTCPLILRVTFSCNYLLDTRFSALSAQTFLLAFLLGLFAPSCWRSLSSLIA